MKVLARKDGTCSHSLPWPLPPSIGRWRWWTWWGAGAGGGRGRRRGAAAGEAERRARMMVVWVTRCLAGRCGTSSGRLALGAEPERGFEEEEQLLLVLVLLVVEVPRPCWLCETSSGTSAPQRS